MLLHVVEAATPVDSAYRTPAAQWREEEVGHAVAFIHDTGDFHPSELPGIERLASRSRIERRLVEVDPPAPFGQVHHVRLEIPDVRVGIIEPVSHGNPAPRKGVAVMGY
jgi:hypothetical protein